MRTAVSRFEKFHGRRPDRLARIPFEQPKQLVYLGRGVAIEYESDKPDPRRKRSEKTSVYRHKLGAGVKIYCDPRGKMVLVLGGRFRVTDWMRD